MATNLTIKDGTYTKVEDVIVIITNTEVITTTTSNEASETIILNTISELQQRLLEYTNSINAEIATNTDMLNQIRSLNRTIAIK